MLECGVCTIGGMWSGAITQTHTPHIHKHTQTHTHIHTHTYTHTRARTHTHVDLMSKNMMILSYFVLCNFNFVYLCAACVFLLISPEAQYGTCNGSTTVIIAVALMCARFHACVRAFAVRVRVCSCARVCVYVCVCMCMCVCVCVLCPG